jgi:hypothetical protein
MPSQSIRRTAIAILHYFSDHPAAKDTAKGIAKWWVGEDLETVEKALALLVKEGVVVRENDRFRLAPTADHKRMIGKAKRRLAKRRN